MRLRMQMPSVDPNVYDRPPERCPLCGGPTWHRPGWTDKAIRGTRLEGGKPPRIQGTSCNHTMRLYPKGITKRKQSERLRGLTILLYLLGISYRGVADVVAALGTFLSHTTVYNNVQDAGQAVRQLVIVHGLEELNRKGRKERKGFFFLPADSLSTSFSLRPLRSLRLKTLFLVNGYAN